VKILMGHGFQSSLVNGVEASRHAVDSFSGAAKLCGASKS